MSLSALVIEILIQSTVLVFVGMSGVKGIALQEASYINKSLSALAIVKYLFNPLFLYL